MKVKILLIILILNITTSAYAQKSVKVEDPVRVQEFYDLTEEENKPFYRYEAELSGVIIDAVNSGLLKPYDVYNYLEPHPLTIEEWLSRLAIERTEFSGESDDDEWGWGAEEDEWGYEEEGETVTYYLSREASLISLDVTKGRKGKKEYRQINYISLYVPAENTEYGITQYLGSFKFDEVKLLFRDKGIIYYPLSRKIVWKDFLLPGYDISSYENFYEKNYNLASLMGIDSASVDIANVLLFLQFNEVIKNGFYHPASVNIYKDDNSGKKDLAAKISSKKWKSYFNQKPEVLYLNDAITTGKLTPLSDYSKHGIEKQERLSNLRPLLLNNGEFVDEEITDLSEAALSYNQTEVVNLKEQANAVLHREDKELSRILMDAEMAGKISLSKNEFFDLYITNEEFIERLTKEISGTEDWDSEKGNKRVIMFLPQQLYLIFPLYKVTFNGKGENKEYEFRGLGLVIPSSETITGIDEIVGYIKADDLHKILYEDPRAEFNQNGTSFNYWDIFNDRLYKGYLKYSTHMQIDK